MRPLGRRIFARLLELLERVVPTSASAVVHGMPITEGNAVEMVNALCRRYDGDVVWLHDVAPGTRLTGGAPRVRMVRRLSMRGVWAYLRGEAVFFTHGLNGTVRPTGPRTFVNLWHGDGVKIKPTFEASASSLFPAHWVSGGTRLLTDRKAVDLKMSPGSVIVCGNPRVEQMVDSVDDRFRTSMGLEPAQRYVIWLPTFRTSANSPTLGTVSPGVTEAMSTVVTSLVDAGVAVIVKPHRQDRESRSVRGLIELDDDRLADAGVSLYALLGSSAGLVTDFSSVWTDYLVLDRPIGFVIPDAEKYRRERGFFPPDLLDWLPGPSLDSAESATAFAREVVSEDGSSADLRRAAAQRLQLADRAMITDRLLEALDERGAFRRGSIGPRSPRIPLVPRFSVDGRR